MTEPIIIDDPEKGTSEVLEATLPAPLTKDDEKAQAIVSLTEVLPSAKTIIAPKKPKRKISRWVQIQLWFNTYR